MDNSRDRELVDRCRRGDRQAAGLLIREYQRPLYNAAYRILGNPDDAADATQAAFLKALEHLDSYDSNYKFFSWIYRIVINESINQLARIRKQQPLDEEEVSTDFSPDSETEAGQLEHGIQEGLMTLTDEYRTVMAMRHFSDLSYKEISEILQIPEKTVKSRLYSARQLMKSHLLEQGIHL